MSDNRGWVYHSSDDNAYIYRASSLGSCIRSLTAARLGEDAFPFNASIRAAMDASSRLEDEILHRFSVEMASSEIIWQQKEVELRVGPSAEQYVIVRGHLDGMYQVDDTILEVKALGDANWDKYMSGGNVLAGLDALGKLGDKYRIQMAVYGHATERNVRLVVGHKVKGDTYVMKNGLGREIPETTYTKWEIEELDISPAIDPESLYSLSDLHARIQFIEECAARDELPECDSNCREGDSYSETHIFTSPTAADDGLSTLIIEYANIRNEIDSLNVTKDALRERIISEHGIGKYTAGSFTARVEHVKPTQRVDGKRLKKEMPDVYEQYSTWGNPTIRLTVTGGTD